MSPGSRSARIGLGGLLGGLLILVPLAEAPWAAAQELEQEREPSIEQLEERRRQLKEEQDELERQMEGARRAREIEETAPEAVELESLSPAEARREARRQKRPRRGGSRSDQKFAFGSTIKIQEGEVASDLLALGGGIKVDGEVLGNAVAVGGSVKVEGRVTGDVVAVGRNVELGPNAEVLGDAISVGGKVVREEGSTVAGRVSEVAVGGDIDFGDWWWINRGIDWGDRGPFSWGAWVDLSWSLVSSLLLLVLTALVLLVVRDPVDRVGRLAFAEPFKALLVGLAVELLFLPAFVVIAVLLAISIIGIPLLLFLPFFLLLLVAASLFGFTGVAVGAGRFLKERFALGINNRLAFLVVGLAGIQGISLAEEFLDGIGLPFFIYALFGLFGFLVKYLAWTTGLGAVVLGRFGSRSTPIPRPPVATPPPLPPLGQGAGAS